MDEGKFLTTETYEKWKSVVEKYDGNTFAPPASGGSEQVVAHLLVTGAKDSAKAAYPASVQAYSGTAWFTLSSETQWLRIETGYCLEVGVRYIALRYNKLSDGKFVWYTDPPKAVCPASSSSGSSSSSHASSGSSSSQGSSSGSSAGSSQGSSQGSSSHGSSSGSTTPGCNPTCISVVTNVTCVGGQIVLTKEDVYVCGYCNSSSSSSSHGSSSQGSSSGGSSSQGSSSGGSSSQGSSSQSSSSQSSSSQSSSSQGSSSSSRSSSSGGSSSSSQSSSSGGSSSGGSSSSSCPGSCSAGTPNLCGCCCVPDTLVIHYPDGTTTQNITFGASCTWQFAFWRVRYNGTNWQMSCNGGLNYTNASSVSCSGSFNATFAMGTCDTQAGTFTVTG